MARKEKLTPVVESVSDQEIKQNSTPEPAPVVQKVTAKDIEKQKADELVERYMEQLLKIK